jgi:hypothetical protein
VDLHHLPDLFFEAHAVQKPVNTRFDVGIDLVGIEMSHRFLLRLSVL